LSLTNQQITHARRDLDEAIRRVESEQTRNQAPLVRPNSALSGRPEAIKEPTPRVSTNPAKVYDFEDIFETTKPTDLSEASDETTNQRRAVVDALNRLNSSSNSWRVVPPIPVIGAIGFALELALYDYLTNPKNAAVPNGGAVLCVFHKNYYPAGEDREHWQVPSELHEAYADQDRNTFLQRAEQVITGTPRITRRILYKRAMEFGCMTLLKQLGYDVEPLRASGLNEGGIDIVAKRPPEAEQETDGRVVAVECKTTRRGFDNERNLIQRVRAALRRSRQLDEVRKVRTLIDRHDGVFDYLIVTNRDFKSSDFRNQEGYNREGYFILRGLEIQ